jgi:hypothetical protein
MVAQTHLTIVRVVEVVLLLLEMRADLVVVEMAEMVQRQLFQVHL